MEVRNIKVQDIKKKKIWALLKSGTEEEDWPADQWEIKEVTKIGKYATILHSAVFVTTKKVYPCLALRDYENGAIFGDYFIYVNGSWKCNARKYSGKCLDGYLSKISTHNSSEYMKGTYDHRKEHYAKFDYYIKQLNKSKIVHYVDEKETLPKKYDGMNTDQLIAAYKKMFKECLQLYGQGTITKYHKHLEKTSLIFDKLKNNPEHHEKLKELLYDEDPDIRKKIIYNTRDLFKKECARVLKKYPEEYHPEPFTAKTFLKINDKKKGFWKTIFGKFRRK